jgi:hypothetical protein
MVDHEYRELDHLVRFGAKAVERCAEVGIGLLHLDCEVGRQAAGTVLSALPGNVGQLGAPGHDHRGAVAVRRWVVEVLRIDDGQLEIIRRRGGGKSRGHDD